MTTSEKQILILAKFRLKMDLEMGLNTTLEEAIEIETKKVNKIKKQMSHFRY